MKYPLALDSKKKSTNLLKVKILSMKIIHYAYEVDKEHMEMY